jgi:hypothetical protein
MKVALLPVGALALICCSLAACDDNDTAEITGPSRFRNEAQFVGVTSLVPAVVVSPGVPLLNCPGPLPGTLPLTVSVSAGAPALTLSEVRIFANDPFRSQTPPTIFDTSGLTRQFASASIASFTTRQFPFTHAFDCGIGISPVLFVSVTTTEQITGLRHTSSLQVPVR